MEINIDPFLPIVLLNIALIKFQEKDNPRNFPRPNIDLGKTLDSLKQKEKEKLESITTNKKWLRK